MTEESRKLLVVEDDPGLQAQLRWCFEGYEVIVAGDRETALAELRKYPFPVMTMDLGLPPDASGTSEGFAALEQILADYPHTKIIVVTGNNERNNALRAVALGAYDFFHKPIDSELLGFIVNRAYRLHELENENRRLHSQQHESPLEGVLTGSQEMLDVCRTVEKVAPADVTVLVLGESGTGKELLARSLHGLSRRSDGPFVAINCAAIPETLLESELFGYEKGAFTGAVKQTPGKIETANGGTLFLDEIGDLPMALQAKLLRFLQERTIERIGGRQEIPVDVRIVCATHQDLMALTKEGKFREDLYYRLAEIVIEIPPLRARVGDPALLAHAFARRFAQEQGRGSLTLSEDAVRAIEAHNWPGNIRELENCIKRATIMADGSQISREDVGLELPAAGDAFDSLDLRTIRDTAEKNAIVAALGRVNGNMVKAAELLGISRPTLYDLMHRLGLK